MAESYQKLATVIGAFCLVAPNCLTWYWGNASVYFLSYILSVSPSDSSLEYPWMISIYRMSWIVSLISWGCLRRFISLRWSFVIAVVISECSLLLTYFSIQRSLILTILALALLQGIGTGIVYGNAIHLVVQCSKGDVGLLTSIIQGAFPSGSIVINQLITLYTNPSNKSPNLILGSTRYFTQKDVVDRVPSMILGIGIFSLIMHVVGLVFLQANPTVRFFARIEDYSPESIPLCDNDAGTASPKEIGKKHDMTPKQVLRNPIFYCLWLLSLMTEYQYVIATNYFKIYGQVWIHDDFFLTNVATLLVFACFCLRLASGVTIDKFGVKNSFIGFLSLTILFGSWYYFTARINRWIYALVTIGYGSFASILPGCYITFSAKIFGKTHVSSNTGLIISSSVFINTIGPPLVRAILVYLGWFFIYSSGGIINSLALILCVVFIPKV